MSHKSNTKFPFKMVYFLGVRGLTFHPIWCMSIPVVDMQTCRVCMYCIYSIHTFLNYIYIYIYLFIYLFIYF